MDINSDILGRVIKNISSEPEAFLICNQIDKLISGKKLQGNIWPISYKKGNLTLGVIDGFFISLFRVGEKKFLEDLNAKIKPYKVKKIFYRFSFKNNEQKESEM